MSELCMLTSGFVLPWHIVLAHKQAVLEKILDDLHIIILNDTLKCLGNLLAQSIGMYIF
jgi:translation initiation factor 6 (eIF-6)